MKWITAILLALALASCEKPASVTPTNESVWRVWITSSHVTYLHGVRFVERSGQTIAFLDSTRSLVAEFRLSAIHGTKAGMPDAAEILGDQ